MKFGVSVSFAVVALLGFKTTRGGRLLGGDNDNRLTKEKELEGRSSLAVTSHRSLNPSTASCPAIGGSIVLANELDSVAIGVSELDTLCALWQTDGERLVAVARSYDGYDWEAYAGPFQTQPITCNSGTCVLDLREPMDGFEYVLTSISHQPTSVKDEAARFFEMTTFGTTRSDLDIVDTTNLKQTFGTWMQEQMGLPASSHREFFRMRANGRAKETTRLGAIRSPCEVGARYRRFAFTKADHKSQLTISTASGRRVLSFGNDVLTTFEGPIHEVDLSNRRAIVREILDGVYAICRKPAEKLYGDLRLKVNGKCVATSLGNPPIDFAPNAIPSPAINLDGIAEVIAEDYYGPLSKDEFPVQSVMLFESSGSSTCDTPASGFTFGIFDNEFWLFDPNYDVKENTLEAPLLDGGDSIITASGGVTKCSNAPRTFVNEAFCRLSFDSPCTVKPVLDPSKGVIVCGSPGEISNDFTLGAKAPNNGAFSFSVDLQKEIVWTELAVRAPDQLRQRMAFALSQILVVTQKDVPIQSPEVWSTLYDIFVRNAFGNYRDLLKEISFSPMMGQMLSYTGNRSRQRQLEEEGDTDSFPDENFAREIMQLFTCGLEMLNQDGTPILDDNMVPIPTYSIDEISEYARVWTGLVGNFVRGNMESAITSPNANRIDPMKIELSDRDFLPKLGLQRKYIGEGFPLCADLPRRDFLMKGAKYRLLGASSSPELHAEDKRWATDGNTKRFSIDSSSDLYMELCNPVDPNSPSTSPCQFTSIVELSVSLDCTGLECEVETVRIVEIGDGVYYEYIRPPCIHQAFYSNPQKIKKTRLGDAMCADPRVPDAAPACCKSMTSDRATLEVAYWGEHVTFATNDDRCTAKLQFTCSTTNIRGCGKACKDNAFYWARESCTLKAMINHDRMVAIVHDTGLSGEETIPSIVNETSVSFFRVVWESLAPVDEILDLCNDPCVRIGDSCLCDITVHEEAAFLSFPTKVDDVMDLSIGAFDVEILEEDYNQAGTEEIKVFYIGTEVYSMDTIFEVVDPISGKTVRRKNIMSTVALATNPDANFRNPVHMISLANPQPRDAYHETDAALDTYMYHPSTAPFLAKLLAQRFGMSNPSPRYVSVIAEAFKSGMYRYDTGDSLMSFGSDVYGDLAATIAAIVLDREARTYLLDADPTFGSMREPAIKVMSLMRSLEFTSKPSTFIFFHSNRKMQDYIGQFAYRAPSVFSFFLPDFIPGGPLKTAQLYSPESKVNVGQSLVNTLNGMSALLKYGLDSCWNGFGFYAGENCSANRFPGDSTFSYGALSYWYTATTTAKEVVSELSTLMTSGRLSHERREIMERVYDAEPNKHYAALKVQELITVSPEFHASGTSLFSGENRDLPVEPVPSGRPYKAVVLLTFGGGMDSFNLLVPHECSGTNAAGETLREQYESVRGDLSFTPEERTEIINAQGQPCEKFAIHDELPIIKRLYDEGQLSFFTNMGMVDQEMTKDNYKAKSRTQLFSHKSMFHEAERVDPFDEVAGTGVLGRMSDVLTSHGYSRGLVAVDGPAPALEGDELANPSVVSSSGFTQFNEKPDRESIYDVEALFLELNNATTMTSSMFGETWSRHALNAVVESDRLVQVLGHAGFSGDGASAETIVKMMAAHEERGVDRDFFRVNIGGWDTHSDMKTRLREQFRIVQSWLDKFESKCRAVDGLWNKVTLVTASDFGRTLTPNSNQGSDHAWAGNYFMMGGEVDGGKIHGNFPSDITPGCDLDVGRGRLLPTLSWEAMWNGVAEWMGVPNEDMLKVIPNRDNAGSNNIFTAADLFQ